MSIVDIRNFVDINIKSKTVASITSTRETTVLFTNDSKLIASGSIVFSSLSEVEAKVGASNLDSSVGYKYAKVYFEAGGVKLKVIYSATISDTVILPLVNNLAEEEIVIGLCDTAKVGASAEVALALAQKYNAQTTSYGVAQKLFLGAIGYTEFTGNTAKYANQSVDNFALKVGDLTKQTGCEMTIGAYLSRIDFYGINTVQDYAYTKESLDVTGYPDNLNTIVKDVLSNNANITIEIANSVRNVGGNLTSGEDLVNKFSLIVLHQTLSQRVFNTLSQKIKGNSAITALYSSISQELNRYITCGYLTTEKYWTNPDLTLSYNNKTYTLITQGTALTQGFKITILPLSSLTDEDKQEHKAPYIYVILADSYGIRKVVINGEVI